MARVDRAHWEVPYLPIDPADVGSSYKETVRVNSQSGKGGVGFVLEEHFGVSLPRAMLVEFSKRIQALTERLDREVRPGEIMRSLEEEYLVEAGPYRLVDYELGYGDDGIQHCTARLEVPDGEIAIAGQGSGPIEAFVNAVAATLNEPLNIVDYRERALGVGKDARAICIVAISEGATAAVDDAAAGAHCYGIGFSRNTVTASLTAIVSAVNRRWKQAG